MHGVHGDVVTQPVVGLGEYVEGSAEWDGVSVGGEGYRGAGEADGDCVGGAGRVGEAGGG